MIGKQINTAILDKNTDGDYFFRKKLVSIYLASTPVLLDEINHYFEKQQYLQIAKVCHNLKSSFITVGAELVAQYIIEMELFFLNENIDVEEAKVKIDALNCYAKQTFIALKNITE